MNMAKSEALTSMEWCLCEMLPRAVLHIPLNEELLCEVCGLARRPLTGLSSSSSDDEAAIEERQQMLLKIRRAEEAQMPNCVQWGRFSYQEDKIRRRNNEPKRTGYKSNLMKEWEPTAPPPPSPPLSPPPESMWQSPVEDVPDLVAMAQEVNYPIHLRKHWPVQYGNLFVSDFIPLDSPITDPSKGAISKQCVIEGRPLPTHRSRPQPPLSKVLADILAREKPMPRAKGGGLLPMQDPILSSHSSQFTPYDHYVGPSEDALVEESARYMLFQPKLYIEPRLDLPSTQLSTFDTELSSTCISPVEKSRPQCSFVRSRMKYESMKVTHTSSSKTSSSSSDSSVKEGNKEVLKVEDESQEDNIYPKINQAEQTLKNSSNSISIMDEVFWTPIDKDSVDEETLNNYIKNLVIQKGSKDTQP